MSRVELTQLLIPAATTVLTDLVNNNVKDRAWVEMMETFGNYLYHLY